MGLITTVEPGAEPVSTSDAKAHLRITHSNEDALIDGYVKAARLAAERFIRRRLITQTVRLTLDGFCDGYGACLTLPVAPIQSIEAVQYRIAAGTWETVASSDYELRTSGGEPWQLCPAYGTTWPVPRTGPDSVRIDLVVGYGVAAADVPQDIVQAINFLVAHFYTHRSAVVTGTIAAELPLGFKAMLQPRVLYL